MAIGRRPTTGQVSGGKRKRCTPATTPETPYVLDDLYEKTSTLYPAILHQRYKRFLGDVTLGKQVGGDGTDGAHRSAKGNDHGSTPSTSDITTVHVPNTGPMTGLLDDLPTEVLLSKSSNEKRKYAHTLEWMKVDGTWVGVHSAKANAMVGQLLDAGALDAHLPLFTTYNREVRLGSGRAPTTRIDFELVNEQTGAKCLVEVKSVTMKDGDVAVFPDTKSDRAQKHVKELVDWKQKHRGEGMECVMMYVVQRDDCERFLPSKEHDPAYYDLVRKAVKEQGLKCVILEIGLEEVKTSASSGNEGTGAYQGRGGNREERSRPVEAVGSGGAHRIVFKRVLPLADF